jgi:hypothetical protein
MDQLYHLPFRDWLELAKGSSTSPAGAEPENDEDTATIAAAAGPVRKTATVR